MRGIGFIATAVLIGAPSLAAAQTRTPWQMNNGLEVTASNPLGLVKFSCSPQIHGDICEYDVATVPPASDPGWGPAPNGDTIGFSIYSRVCQAPITCLAYGDFTYFQTFVDVPTGTTVTQFTINFQGMDDGARVSIFNSTYPTGLIIPGSYVFLGGSGTTDLSPYVKSGEINRVVVTQVDDCCSGNNLQYAAVVLNGQSVQARCVTAADCTDHNACTADVCNPDGSCSNPPLSCDDGNACTTDSCDTQSGCMHQPITCNDFNGCTTDTCNPQTGCVFTPLSTPTYGPGAAGRICASGGDCQSGSCSIRPGNIRGYCQTPACTDHVQNGAETDVDCGGDRCAPCHVGQVCLAPRDCDTKVCSGCRCAAPTCSDGVLNGNETDVDCGGPDCSRCHDGQRCNTPADCRDGDGCTATNPAVNPQRYCRQPNTCTNKMFDPSLGETDTDCGGPCKPCADHLRCSITIDCINHNCNFGVCGGGS